MRRPLVAAVAVALALASSAGAATITGTRGADRIVAHGNGTRDRISCGGGRDIVNADADDQVAADCEVLSRQLSADATSDPGAQHQTQVEPDSFAYGRTIVTTFQSGRHGDGGAAAIGWATSHDAGGSWAHGFLALSTPRASDPSVAYDAVHRVWLISILSIASQTLGLQVSRSSDGVRWSAPATVAAGTLPSGGYDKGWIACDNWPSSQFRGRCYLSSLNVATDALETRWSGDGGVTWSSPAITSMAVSGASEPNGAMPVPRPDGSLVIGFLVAPMRAGAPPPFIAATRSVDGGVTFSAVTTIAPLGPEPDQVPGMRAPPLPSLDVDASGRVYAAWHDCAFFTDCLANDIVLATSADGVTWSTPTRVPTRNANDRTDEFLPGLAVEPSTGRLAIAYYSLRQGGCEQSDCAGLNVSVIRSPDRGTTWGRPQRLNADPMRPSWIADTDAGRMVGDYISTSWVGGRPVPVFSLASARDAAGVARQSIFAGVRIAS